MPSPKLTEEKDKSAALSVKIVSSRRRSRIPDTLKTSA